MIDLSPMKSVRVDPAARTARVEPGAHARATSTARRRRFGLATPLGINSTTGVAGLTLGGGFGWLSRKLRAARSTTCSRPTSSPPTARCVRASDDGEPRPVLGDPRRRRQLRRRHLVRVPAASGRARGARRARSSTRSRDAPGRCSQHYRDFVASAPDELTCWVVLRKAPPLPFLPAEVHGKEVLVLAVVLRRRRRDGRDARSRRCGRFGKPIARRRRADAVRGLADGLRSAAHAGRAQLLEVARLHGARATARSTC